METQQGVVKTRDVLSPYRKLLFAHFEKHELIPKLEHADYLDVITNEGKALIIPDFRNTALMSEFAKQKDDDWKRRGATGYMSDPVAELILADLHSAQQKTGYIAWVKNRYHAGSHNHSPYMPFDTEEAAIKWLIRWGRPKAAAAAFLQNYMREVLAEDEDDTLGAFFYALIASKGSGEPIEFFNHASTIGGEDRFPGASMIRRAGCNMPMMAADAVELGQALFQITGKVLGSCEYNESN